MNDEQPMSEGELAALVDLFETYKAGLNEVTIAFGTRLKTIKDVLGKENLNPDECKLLWETPTI